MTMHILHNILLYVIRDGSLSLKDAVRDLRADLIVPEIYSTLLAHLPREEEVRFTWRLRGRAKPLFGQN